MKQEILNNINKSIPTVSIKGKSYVMVNERIKRFREFVEDGSIVTEIVELADGVVTIKATVIVDGDVVATGHAQEKESSSFINQTSYIENCETSAIGRALGIAGIGIDDSLGSADEVANAINNQGRKQNHISDVEAKSFKERCELNGFDPYDILKKVGWSKGKITDEQHGKALILLGEMENGQ